MSAPLETNHRPLGVFDSGIGGLTVLRAIHARLPREGTVYLGDTARVPYGTRSSRVVCRYAVNNARFLLERADIKLLIVACNTASAVALPALAEAVDVPVLGVVEPGARLAVEATRSGRVAVIGTRGTIASGAYQREIERLDPAIEVTPLACPLLVPLAEEGWTEGPIATEVVRRYLGSLPRAKVDTVVLGCTHYPLFKRVISEVLGDDVRLVDSAEAVAGAVAGLLGESPGVSGVRGDPSPLEEASGARRRPPGGRHGEPPTAPPEPERRIFVTDVPEAFGDLAARFLGHDAPPPLQVDISV